MIFFITCHLKKQTNNNLTKLPDLYRVVTKETKEETHAAYIFEKRKLHPFGEL